MTVHCKVLDISLSRQQLIFASRPLKESVCSGMWLTSSLKEGCCVMALTVQKDLYNVSKAVLISGDVREINLNS